MRFLFIMFTIVLAGCTVIVGNYYKEKDQPPITAEVKKGCDRINLPVIAPMPDVPVIPERLIHNREATDKILIENISELREHVKTIKAEYKRAIEAHLKTCQ